MQAPCAFGAQRHPQPRGRRQRSRRRHPRRQPQTRARRPRDDACWLQRQTNPLIPRHLLRQRAHHSSCCPALPGAPICAADVPVDVWPHRPQAMRALHPQQISRRRSRLSLKSVAPVRTQIYQPLQPRIASVCALSDTRWRPKRSAAFRPKTRSQPQNRRPPRRSKSPLAACAPS